MKCKSVVFVFSMLLPWINTQQEFCITPLGARSQCINLYQCPQLLAAFTKLPVANDTTSFLRQSACGFEGAEPKVCCGPLPTSKNTTSQTTQNPSEKNQNYLGPSDSIKSEDSQPAPGGECGLDTIGIENRVYGGDATGLNEFPWMALLCYRSSHGNLSCRCGGALINHRYVLTAAHCLIGAVEKVAGELAAVRLGEYNLDTPIDCIDGQCADPPQEIPVQAKYPHSTYRDGDLNRNGDIGLVRLARRVTFSNYVQPICLVDRDVTRLNAGTTIFIAGWGKTLEGTNSRIKLKLEEPIYDKGQCVNKYSTFGAEISQNQICAGGNFGESACKGDSGGPLMKTRGDGIWETVGVISFGYGCGRNGWPGVATSVEGYLDWILYTLRSTNV